MVQIYNEITIYFYKEIFSSGASPPNPRLPPDPPTRRIALPNPTEGVPPLCTPPRGRVYILMGCKVVMGYKHS